VFISVRGRIAIGDNTIFGLGVKIFAENHNFQGLKILIYLQEIIKQRVNTDKDVVNKDIPDYVNVSDISAKILKMRDQ
jgi:acetyltransferase-like isoleucine patch superfamily enzyme